jgi:hypothetical protein
MRARFSGRAAAVRSKNSCKQRGVLGVVSGGRSGSLTASKATDEFATLHGSFILSEVIREIVGMERAHLVCHLSDARAIRSFI